MAWDINKVVLVGRLSSDVELKHNQSSDKSVARFSIAVSGMSRDSVSFFNVVVWGKSAETANQYLSKGKQVAIDGRLEQRTWTTQNGSHRSVVEIIAERLQFLGVKDNKDDYNPPSRQQEPINKNEPFDDEVPF